jgi:hypothetical protein
MWNEIGLKNIATGHCCCLQCDDAKDLVLAPNQQRHGSQNLKILPHFFHFATNHSAINSHFPGRQFTGTVTHTSVDLSCPPIKLLAKSKYVFTFSPSLSTQFCRNCGE